MSFVAKCGLLFLGLIASALGVAVGRTLQNRRIWIPALVVLVGCCIAAVVLLLNIGLMK